MEETKLVRQRLDKVLKVHLTDTDDVLPKTLKNLQNHIECVVALENALRAYKEAEATCDITFQDEIATRFDVIQSNFDVIFKRLDSLEEVAAEKARQDKAHADFVFWNSVKRR